jgi:hypothetical protein
MFPVITVTVGVSNKSTYADRQVRLRVPAWDMRVCGSKRSLFWLNLEKLPITYTGKRLVFAMPGVPLLPIDLEGDVDVDMNVVLDLRCVW